MMTLTVNGRELRSLEIISYVPKIELLDGPGTGRSNADLWDMIRQPQGYILNFQIEIYSTLSTNEDFKHLYNTCLSLGSIEFVPVTVVDLLGNDLTQNMYFTLEGIEFRRSNSDNSIRTGNIKANFIAQRGNKYV